MTTTVVDRPDWIKEEDADNTSTHANSGKVRIYSGTKPNVNSEPSGNTVLAEWSFAADAAPASTAGALTFSLTGDSNNDASGLATFYRAYKSTGYTVSDMIFQGEIGATGSGASMTLADPNLVEGGTSDVTSFTMTFY